MSPHPPWSITLEKRAKLLRLGTYELLLDKKEKEKEKCGKLGAFNIVSYKFIEHFL